MGRKDAKWLALSLSGKDRKRAFLRSRIRQPLGLGFQFLRILKTLRNKNLLAIPPGYHTMVQHPGD